MPNKFLVISVLLVLYTYVLTQCEVKTPPQSVMDLMKWEKNDIVCMKHGGAKGIVSSIAFAPNCYGFGECTLSNVSYGSYSITFINTGETQTVYAHMLEDCE